MKQPQQDVQALVLSILNVAKKQIGADRLREVLSQADLYGDGQEELLREFVILRTCKEFAITYQRLINGRTNGIRTTALMVTVHLLSKYLQYSQRQISDTLKKSPGRINQFITEFGELDDKLTHHAEVLKKVEAIEKNIAQFNKHLNEK